MTTNTPQKSSLLGYTICTLATFYYLYEFLLRVMPSVMSQELMTDLQINAAGFGLIGALFFWGYAPMQIPAGLLIDRYGARKILTFSVLLCAVATIMFSMTHSFAIVGLARLFIGVASASAYVGILVLAANWFPPQYFSMIAGLAQIMGCVGAIAGQAPIAIAVSSYGWRQTTFWAGVICAVLALLFWLLIQDHPKDHPIQQATKPRVPFKKQVALVLRNRQVNWVGVYAITSWTPVSIFATLWGPSFLRAAYDMTPLQASSLLTSIWIGISVGGPILGWWSNRINRRVTPCILASAMLLVTSCLLLYVHLSWVSLYALLFFYGFAASVQAVTFGFIQDLVPPQAAGTGVGYNNMMVVLGGVILQPLVGVLLNRLSDHGVYGLVDYQKALSIIPITSFAGLILSSFFVKETHCKIQYNA